MLVFTYWRKRERNMSIKRDLTYFFFDYNLKGKFFSFLYFYSRSSLIYINTIPQIVMWIEMKRYSIVVIKLPATSCWEEIKRWIKELTGHTLSKGTLQRNNLRSFFRLLLLLIKTFHMYFITKYRTKSSGTVQDRQPCICSRSDKCMIT